MEVLISLTRSRYVVEEDTSESGLFLQGQTGSRTQLHGCLGAS